MPTAERAGQAVTYEDDCFLVDGYEEVLVQEVREYDRQGLLDWTSEALRKFVYEMPDEEWEEEWDGAAGDQGEVSVEATPSLAPQGATSPTTTSASGEATHARRGDSPDPHVEDGEVVALEERISELTDEMADRELDLAKCRGELLRLQMRHLAMIDARLAELRRVEARVFDLPPVSDQRRDAGLETDVADEC